MITPHHLQNRSNLMQSFKIIISFTQLLFIACYPVEDSLTGPESGQSRIFFQGKEYVGEAVYIAEAQTPQIRMLLQDLGPFSISLNQFHQGEIHSSDFQSEATPLLVTLFIPATMKSYFGQNGRITVTELDPDFIRGDFDFMMLDAAYDCMYCPEALVRIYGEFYALRNRD